MVMSLIESLTRIRNAVYGREVREAIHDGVFRANQVADENKDLVERVAIRQDAVEQYNNQMITEMTDKDVISAPELIESRDGEDKLSARLDRDFGTLNTEVTATNNLIKMYVSPDNFDTLDDCIDYARANKLIIKVKELVLTKPTNFRGVGIEIEELHINAHSVTLGDYNTSLNDIPEGVKPIRPTQTIGVIYGRNGWNSEVFVRGASYQTIKVGAYSGNIQLVVNKQPNDNFIAYNEFYFRDVRGVVVRSDEASIDTLSGWVNENKFYLMNSRIFKLGDAGGYNHNNNFVFGGTFEGNGLIEVIKGSNNYFYDIRAEQNLKIRFHKEASRNLVELSAPFYLATVKDDSGGNDNVVLGADERHLRVKYQHSISTNHEIGGNESGYNVPITSPFKNITFDEASLKLKERVRETGAGNNILYVSPYISAPQTTRVLMEAHISEGNLGIGYKLYDQDYNDITADFISGAFDPYIMTTHASHISTNVNEGQYFGASSALQLRSNTQGAVSNPFSVKNDIINLIPAGMWRTASESSISRSVKYVKFFVGNTGSNTTLSFYDLSVTIYDMTSNYHKRYFSNQARLIDWTQPQ